MFKRILRIALVVLLLGNAAFLVVQVGEHRGWFGFGSAERQTQRFRQVLEVVQQLYVDPAAATPEKLTDSALTEMVHALDPHSEFLTRRDYTKVQSDLKSEFGGIGVQIELLEDKVVVVAPIAGTPGDRAGILRGDRIVKVDGRALEAPLLRNAIDRLRGAPGTNVGLALERSSLAHPVELELVRELIKVDTIRAVSMVAPDIGYIQITQFTERTAAEFKESLARLEGSGLRSLVIDLRNNPGGLLSAAVEVLSPFFRDGELAVYTQGRDAGSRRDLKAKGSGRERRYPIAVLVNSGSASAAEIVTGALHDTHRAVVIGERTFGKGSVQTLLPLADGEALRLTTAKYYTPGGQVIHGHGIAPDVELAISAEDDRKLGIQRLRGDLTDRAAFKERFDFEPIADRQLEAAIDVLHGVLVFAPSPTLSPAQLASHTLP